MENIDIELSDVDKSCLEALGFSLSESFAVKNLGTCRVTLRAWELQIKAELKTLSGMYLCSSSGPTVLEALWNLRDEWRQARDEFEEMSEDLDDIAREAENEYTRDEP